MKRIICLALLISVFLCGCKSSDAVSSETEIYSEPTLQSRTVSEEENEEKEESTPEKVQSEPQSQVSSVVPEPKAPPVSVPQKSAETYQKPVTEPEVSLGFTVNDPDNLRGLATDRHGFSYGVAKNGVPHNQSVSNQSFFDSLSGVSALALDTKSQAKRLYLTFDCGYEYNGLTGKILDTLSHYGVKASFFCTLDYIKKNPQFISRMINEGHIVGNHSATHPSFPSLTRTQMANEIYRVEATLKENFGYSSPYFRFPEGAYSECALELATSVGYRSVFWSVAYADWDTSKQLGTANAYDTVTARLHPGAVILLHAVSVDNANALGSIIDYAVQNGYTFCSLDEYPW